jgi:hypothetical protein
MKESYFQQKVKDAFTRDGFMVLNLSDSFTGGIPDTYLLKDGISYWLELKVTNKKPGQIVHLDDRKASGRGFTREQALKLYQLKKKGAQAHGVIYLAHDKVALKIPPERMEESHQYEDLIKEFEEFII